MGTGWRQAVNVGVLQELRQGGRLAGGRAEKPLNPIPKASVNDGRSALVTAGLCEASLSHAAPVSGELSLEIAA